MSIISYVHCSKTSSAGSLCTDYIIIYQGILSMAPSYVSDESNTRIRFICSPCLNIQCLEVYVANSLQENWQKYQLV